MKLDLIRIQATKQYLYIANRVFEVSEKAKDKLQDISNYKGTADERGDVPGWVLVVLMTTGLVTAIWTIAAPRLSAILKNSLDAMNGIR